MLGPRLRAIARMVPKGGQVADIGTDHGIIPVYLIKKDNVAKAIATDISPGSLEKAIDLVKGEGLEDRISLRLGSGLKAIEPGEVDTIIIAGMGGNLISEILKDSPTVTGRAEKLILQPMSRQRELRKWLAQNGYRVVDEALVKEDRRIYEIIVATPGRQRVVHDIQYDIGFMLMEKKDPLFEEFLKNKMEKTRSIINGLEKGGTLNSEIALKAFQKKLLEYEEAYGCFLRLRRQWK